MIADIYSQVNSVLSQVQGFEWTARHVPEDGVVINSYGKDGAYKYVIINYTEHEVAYQGTTVMPESAAVVGKE